MLDKAPSVVPVRGLLTRLVRTAIIWNMKRGSRLALRDLDASQLRDIGITREQAVIEARKAQFPFK